ncbi:hypothetical protein Tco_1254363 [Tanacetum coccineum]
MSTYWYHSNDGNPSRANIKQALRNTLDYESLIAGELRGCLLADIIFQNHKSKEEGNETLMNRVPKLRDDVCVSEVQGECSNPVSDSKITIDDEVVQDQRQQDDNDLQDERQDQPKEEEVEPRRSKMARTEKLFGPDFVSFMIENEPTFYREAVTFSEWINGKKPLKVK